MNKMSTIIMVMATFLILTVSVGYAETFNWDNGGADGDWNVAGNWDLNKVPDSSDDLAFIDNGATVTVSSPVEWLAGRTVMGDQQGSSGSLVVDNTNFWMNSEIQVGGNGTGSLTINGADASVKAQGSALIVGRSSSGSGTVNHNNGTLYTYRASVGVDGQGVYNMTGGTMEAGGVTLGTYDDGDGTVYQTGGTFGIWTATVGTVQIGGLGDVGVSPGGSALYEISGGTLNAVGWYNSHLKVGGNQNADATLRIVGSDSTVRTSWYTQNEYGTLAFVLDELGVSPVTCEFTAWAAEGLKGGAASLAGDLIVDFDGNAFDIGYEIILINAPSGITGIFDSVTLLGGKGLIDYRSDSVVLIVIPEPASFGLLLLGLLTVFTRRRIPG